MTHTNTQERTCTLHADTGYTGRAQSAGRRLLSFRVRSSRAADALRKPALATTCSHALTYELYHNTVCVLKYARARSHVCVQARGSRNGSINERLTWLAPKPITRRCVLCFRPLGFEVDLRLLYKCLSRRIVPADDLPLARLVRLPD
jgi:hypothetical protein